MTSVPTIVAPTPPTGESPRLVVKPKGPLTGHVDGGWWPRSRDLAAEMPALLDALGARMGPVGSLSYHFADWDLAPRRLTHDGHVVRLRGYRLLPTGTVDVISGSTLITLVVVPPQTADSSAHALLTAAGSAGNTDDVATLTGVTPGTTPTEQEPRP